MREALGLDRFDAGIRDAITDVPGVGVGHATIIAGEGPLQVGSGPVRTGLTVVKPHEGDVLAEPLFAGYHRLNGNGELTGAQWITESGLLSTPIALTNTHSVGVVRDAIIARLAAGAQDRGDRWIMPVVAETWDGVLNDINGQHVRPEHVEEGFASVSFADVPTGNVGGGTGMICHGFKGGIGTSSRRVPHQAGSYTVGVLVQANHGRRERLQFGTVPLGQHIGPELVPLPGATSPGAATAATRPPDPAPTNMTTSGGAGSIVVVIATDAPLLPHQLNRLAQRAGLGVARTGGAGEHSSGDLFLAFSTAHRGMPADHQGVQHDEYQVRVLHNSGITALFDAVIETTEAAILSALLGAQTMTGRDDCTAWALSTDHLQSVIEV